MARGTLRIYVGAAPGVGKTFAMLNEGWRRKERGTDVVVGFLETHGRALTAAQLRDLEVVPRRVDRVPGPAVRGDGPRRGAGPCPRVALVDELAHTNVPGCRNTKRWQDIDELLAAGIDVISTVNIQHLESLNDVVERITGVVQRETVPDAVVRARRPDRARRHDPRSAAAAHGPRQHLRRREGRRRAEPLLPGRQPRSAAGAGPVVGRRSRSTNRSRSTANATASPSPGRPRERVVVALTGAPGGSGSFDAVPGWRLARTPSSSVSTSEAPTDSRVLTTGLLERHRALLDELGGRFAEVTGADPADALVRFARAENATQILLGSSHRSRWAELTRGSVINQVIRAAGPIDVHVISADEAPSHRGAMRERARPVTRLGARRARGRSLGPCALIGIPLVVLALIPLRDAMGVPGTLLLLLVGPIAVAVLGGLVPALAASLVDLSSRRLVLHRADAQPPVRPCRRCARPGGVRCGLGARQRPRRSAGPPQRAAGAGAKPRSRRSPSWPRSPPSSTTRPSTGS